MQVRHIDTPRGKYVSTMQFSPVRCSRVFVLFFSDTPNRSAENQRGTRGNVAGHKTEVASRERLGGCSRWVPYFDQLSFLWNQRRYQFWKTSCACLLRQVTLKRGRDRGGEGGHLALSSKLMCLHVLWICIFEGKECKVQWIPSNRPLDVGCLYKKWHDVYDEISGFLFLLLRSRCGLFLPL